MIKDVCTAAAQVGAKLSGLNFQSLGQNNDARDREAERENLGQGNEEERVDAGGTGWVEWDQ